MTAGNSKPTSTATMATTTSNSIRVKPRRPVRITRPIHARNGTPILYNEPPELVAWRLAMEAADNLRVVLVHDWLTGMRGGEKCLEALCRRLPRARLFNLLHR